MDLQKTGNFIAQQRKAKNLTQAKLAEKLHVSEKTVSKWECGNGFPDTSLIMPLCEALEISANELLSAEKINDNQYKEYAEHNLVTLQAKNTKNTKLLFLLEWVLGLTTSVFFMILIFIASFCELATGWRIGLIIIGFLQFIVGVGFCLRIEKEAGFYECGHCHEKYIPTYKQVLFSMHHGRNRYMKCPKCGKYSWNKKVINKD